MRPAPPSSRSASAEQPDRHRRGKAGCDRPRRRCGSASTPRTPDPLPMLFMHSPNACRRLCSVAPARAATGAAAFGFALWLEWPSVDNATTAPTTATAGRIVPKTSFAADGALSGFGGGVGHQPGSENRSAIATASARGAAAATRSRASRRGPARRPRRSARRPARRRPSAARGRGCARCRRASRPGSRLRS
jgi:hypothetical protein